MRLIALLLLLIPVVAFSQKKGKEKDKPKTEQPAPVVTAPVETPKTAEKPNDTLLFKMMITEHALKKYAAASRWNDLEAAKEALYDIIVENPVNDSLIYSLAYYYYENQKFASSMLIAQDLLYRDSKNPVYLEMAAVSAEQLGARDKALGHYESLYLLTGNIQTLYQITFLQYSLKRYTESVNSADILLSKPEVNTLKVVYNDAQGKPKEYPMKAALLNLKGVIAMEQNDKVAAKKFYTEALTVGGPDFLPAKTNMEKLNK